MNGVLEQQIVARRPRRLALRRYRSLFKIAFLLVLVIGFGTALGWGLTHSDTFALRRIEVVGRLEKLTAGQIVAAAGLHTGVNLFSLDLQDLEAGISRLPWLRSVSIRRQVPDTLWIHAAEQNPRALLLDGRLFFVSAQGVVFKGLEEEAERDFVVITGMKAGQNFETALELIDFFEQNHDLALFGLSEIHYNAAIGYSVVTLKGPIEVKLGRGDFEKKLERLKKVWSTLEPRIPALRGIDLNDEERAIVKL